MATETLKTIDIDEVKVHTVTDKRICDEPDCDTVLSIYNKREFCALHQPMIIPRMRGTVLK